MRELTSAQRAAVDETVEMIRTEPFMLPWTVEDYARARLEVKASRQHVNALVQPYEPFRASPHMDPPGAIGTDFPGCVV